MGDDLHRLVYYSRSRITGGVDVLMTAVDDILAASQRNNTSACITGALMFNAGCFGQILEGNREALEATFERIQRDERHGEVSLLAFEPIAARTFGHWSMGFVGARLDHAEVFSRVAMASGFDPSQATSDDLLKTLESLAIADEALAA